MKGTKARTTAAERRDIIERQNRLRQRINQFNTKAEQLLPEDVDDLEIFVLGADTRQKARVRREAEDEERKSAERLRQASKKKVVRQDNAEQESDDWEDEDEPQADQDLTDRPEHDRLWLPSTLGREGCEEVGWESIAGEEMKLREGQMNEALETLRMTIGTRTLLLRKRRGHHSQAQKTRSRADVNKLEERQRKAARSYKEARDALFRLGPSEEIKQKYKALEKDDLKLSADILEENRIDQKNDRLPWIWRISGDRRSSTNSVLDECKICH